MPKSKIGEFCLGGRNHTPAGKRWILLCAVFLLVGFAVSCRGRDEGMESGAGSPAGETGALSKEQIAKLVPRIKENTPENTHFARNTKFEWVFLELSGENPKGINDAVTAEFRKAYPTVYLAEKEIPENRLVRGQNNILLGYDKGFRFSFEIKMPERNTIEIRYGDWEGNRAASGCTIRYKWGRGEWVGTQIGPRVVS